MLAYILIYLFIQPDIKTGEFEFSIAGF